MYGLRSTPMLRLAMVVNPKRSSFLLQLWALTVLTRREESETLLSADSPTDVRLLVVHRGYQFPSPTIRIAMWGGSQSFVLTHREDTGRLI